MNDHLLVPLIVVDPPPETIRDNETHLGFHRAIAHLWNAVRNPECRRIQNDSAIQDLNDRIVELEEEIRRTSASR